MKMNASLFPYRCILSGLGPRPGIFYATILVRSRWMMATFIDEATGRERLTKHRSGISLWTAVWPPRLLSKDPEPSGHWWSQRYPWDLVTILTEGHRVTMSSVLPLVPDPCLQPLIGPCSCSQHLLGMLGMISCMWAMRAALIPSI